MPSFLAVSCKVKELFGKGKGAYVASIKFYNKPIPGSPFKIDVVPAPDASKCRAYGPALHPNSLHIAGTPLDLYVDAKKAGTGELQVVVKGPNDTRPKVFQANDNNVHSLKFDVPDQRIAMMYSPPSQGL